MMPGEDHRGEALNDFRMPGDEAGGLAAIFGKVIKLRVGAVVVAE